MFFINLTKSKCLISGLLFSVFSSLSIATDNWQFKQKIAVTSEPQKTIYHHLEGAGRKHIAVSDNWVAITWEDDRSGDPQVHVAFKKITDNEFTHIKQVSTGEEAYEPSISALDKGKFAVAWEQDGRIKATIISKEAINHPLTLSKNIASHASITTLNNQTYVVWREQNNKKWNLWLAKLVINSNHELKIQHQQSVLTSATKTPILFPSISINPAGLTLAWEDREAGHTRLKFAASIDQGKSFNAPEYLNEFYSDRNIYDRGNGVTRVSINSFGEDEVVAAWMDKRRSGGYGIFASLGGDGGEYFGPNEKAHGLEGDTLPHYNPATAGNSEGLFVIAWDDYRKGDSDIWLSNYNEDDEWSSDFAVPVASGQYEQSHPAVTLDQQGGLHLLWIERQTLNSASRLWYSYGQLKSHE